MQRGSRGIFVISWAQTEVDGVQGAPRGLLTTGATWRWHGSALRVDGPQSLLVLQGDPAGDALRRRAMRSASRLGRAPAADRRTDLAGPAPRLAPEDLPPSDRAIVLTDGRHSYEALLIPATDAAPDAAWEGAYTDTPCGDLLAFDGALPPAGAELWVVRGARPPMRPRVAGRAGLAALICFTPGTEIATPRGPRRIEALMPGDRILTKDNGPQPVVWTGRRRLSGARLYAQPELRPIRFRAGAFGIGRPDPDLLVSPRHRMLVRGPAAGALFNAPEVLVAAQDLVDGGAISVDGRLAEVTYVHILLERHQIIWANGLETESFHPSGGALETLGAEDRAALFAAWPDLAWTPQAYGDFARRELSAPEAAILRHDAA
ncbi:hypothetical protein U879_10725 [Defluviimonas sp. 20V17]|uniref:Hint domain-containing protein n=1 Tax=Allgaiera indica TaxID=765699 RepID=A0AAN4ZYB3_9RHOB|nr:Hint domain-containing protein [Allgaiera indica]KDB03719.1 hypothetical protein U879_10725 [Defluviimonas sp. 20V17]GHD99817.1 hypothetical protein GCM10008024_08970 [Allgaiera indica]SDW43017.1 Hint domain-containing protein [Allgaiera indica]